MLFRVNTVFAKVLFCSDFDLPPGRLFISNTFEGVLNRDEGLFERGGGALIQFSEHDGIGSSQRTRMNIKWKTLVT